MFATYNQSGVSFAYPENWTLEEDSDDDASMSVTVMSPNTAFWNLIVYKETLDLANVVGQAVDALKAEYPELETTEAIDEVAGEPLTGIDANFFYLDLTSTCRIRARHVGETTYLILSQSEDRELERVDAVFGAITQSLLSEMPQDEVRD